MFTLVPVRGGEEKSVHVSRTDEPAPNSLTGPLQAPATEVIRGGVGGIGGRRELDGVAARHLVPIGVCGIDVDREAAPRGLTGWNAGDTAQAPGKRRLARHHDLQAAERGGVDEEAVAGAALRRMG